MTIYYNHSIIGYDYLQKNNFVSIEAIDFIGNFRIYVINFLLSPKICNFDDIL